MGLAGQHESFKPESTDGIAYSAKLATNRQREASSIGSDKILCITAILTGIAL